MKINNIDEKIVLQANIECHTKLAKTYNEDSPHYKQENKDRVKNILLNLKNSLNDKNLSLLDIGCGTGFIIDLAVDLFDEVTGIDITEAMINRVNKYKNVNLVIGNINDMPFKDNSFNVCTAYGVLHHLFDLEKALREVYRCLKPNGFFYSDSDPNKHYFMQFYNLDIKQKFSPFINKEIESILLENKTFSEKYQVDPDIVGLSEFWKNFSKGLDPQDIINIMEKIGFKNIRLSYEWFLGQGYVMHQQSINDVKVIENYLRESLPISKYMFKYLSFIAQK